jgi:HAD superfamily hydrolase (TIGR01490 family)
MSRRLALFDFDGTITDRDTMFAFVRHARGPVRAGLGLIVLAPILVGFALRLVPRDRAKVALLRYFFAGTPRETLERWARGFVDRIEGWIRPEARRRLDWHRAQGHDIVIVSASLDVWLAPWAERYSLRLLCTEGRFEDDVFTGELATPNCHGPEKEARVRAAFDLDAYEYVYAYGDSSGDTEMLAIADECWFRPFRA